MQSELEDNFADFLVLDGAAHSHCLSAFHIFHTSRVCLVLYDFCVYSFIHFEMYCYFFTKNYIFHKNALCPFFTFEQGFLKLFNRTQLWWRNLGVGEIPNDLSMLQGLFLA